MEEQYDILVIDDEPHIVELIKNILEFENYKVRFAYNGIEGIEQVKVKEPSLIILDIMMPEMDGYEFTEKLKTDDKYKDIPIVMLTAKGKTSDMQKGYLSGVEGYISKPFNSYDLLGVIKIILNQKEEQETGSKEE